MYISKLNLWNFRKYGSSEEFDLSKPNVSVNFSKGLNLLIGENDSGKSAIVDAIKLALKTTSYEWIKVSHDDFFENENRLRIELFFDDISTREAANFPEFGALDGFKVAYDVRRVDGRILPSDLKASYAEEGHVLNAEVRELLKVTYLKPLRDATTELIPKKNSRLSQILQEHSAFKLNEDGDHLLLDAYKEFNSTIEFYFKGKSKDGITQLADTGGNDARESIENAIHKFFSEDNSIALTPSKADMKKLLEVLDLSLQDVINPGLGSLNRLFMASELVHINRDNHSGIKVGLIEEIEAHLHPQTQLKVIEYLQSLTETQLILTTHSPNLASKVSLENIILCKNSQVFPLNESSTMLTEENYKFLEKFLDVTKSNLFFAKGLILVEGWSEDILIPEIAKKIGLPLIDKEVSVINVANLGFSHYYKIFQRKDKSLISMPISILTDSDVREYEKKPDGCVAKKGKSCYDSEKKTQITAKKEKFAPFDVFVGEEWTLEWCLYKSKIFGEKFQEIVKQVHSGTDWSSFEEILARKLIERSLNKAEIAYRLSIAIAEDKIIFEESDFNSEETMLYVYEAIKNAYK